MDAHSEIPATITLWFLAVASHKWTCENHYLAMSEPLFFVSTAAPRHARIHVLRECLLHRQPRHLGASMIYIFFVSHDRQTLQNTLAH